MEGMRKGGSEKGKEGYGNKVGDAGRRNTHTHRIVCAMAAGLTAAADGG